METLMLWTIIPEARLLKGPKYLARSSRGLLDYHNIGNYSGFYIALAGA